jgi:hypothetical protein
MKTSIVLSPLKNWLPSLFVFLFLPHFSNAQNILETGVFYELRNFTTDMAISTKGAKDNEAKLYQIQKVGPEGQWEFIKVGDFYRIRNKDSRQYIANFKQMGHAAEMKQTNGPGEGALWKAIQLKNGYYQFQNKLSQLYLANGAVTQEGTPIYQVENPGDGSYWALIDITPHVANIKKDQVIEKIEKANSMNDIREAIMSGRLSTKEMESLQKELEKQGRKGKLEQLIKKEEEEMRTKHPQPSNDMQLNFIKNYKKQIDRSFNQNLKIRNDEAIHMAQSLKANTINTKVIKNVRTLPAEQVISWPTEETPAMIHQVLPENLTVGETATITGTDFRNETGRVALVLGREMYFAEIIHWNSSSIQVKIPEALNPVLGASVREIRLWVKLAGGEIGPYTEILLSPDLDRITPKIDEISSTTITEGQLITISGENFLDEEGKVVLNLGNLCLYDSNCENDRSDDPTFAHQFELRVEEWADNFIQVELKRYLAGFKEGGAVLEITNQYGLKKQYPIHFTPHKILSVFYQKIYVCATCKAGFRYYCDGGCKKPNGVEIALPIMIWGHKENFRSWPGEWFCQGSGPREYTLPEHFEFVDLQLIQNWKTGWGGSNIVTQSPSGLRTINYEIEVWADLFSEIEVSLYMYVLGPYNIGRMNCEYYYEHYKEYDFECSSLPDEGAKWCDPYYSRCY